MKEIRVTVRDKIATGDGTRIVCGNSDYTVRFDLDSEWDQFITRTMLVVYADRTFDEVVFKGDCVELPVVINQLGISIGLYAGDLRTTTPAYFDCIKSARCGLGQHANPPEDVYNQLVRLVESGAVKGDKGEKGDKGDPGKTAYQYAQDGGYTGTEAEFAAKLAQELPEPYTLPPATADTLGGMMPGGGLSVDETGRVRVDNELELLLTHEVTAENRADAYRFEFDDVSELECYMFFPKIEGGTTERVSGYIGHIGYYIEDALNSYADRYCLLRYKKALGRFGFDGIHAAREGYSTLVKTIGMFMKPQSSSDMNCAIAMNSTTQGYPIGTKFDIYGKKVKRDA